MSIKEKVLLIIIIVVMAVQFLFAVVTVPYNYDSMTYHLPRILMWIQNHSVSYYATSIIRQNVSPVLAEYNNLHWMLLWGSDQFANLVQYKAYLFNAVLIWAILDELGCRRVWKLISVLLYMTMSLTLAESISTQTDLFACGWLMCTIYLALVIRSKEHLSINREDVFDMFELAVSVGLTYLAKPNLCITSVIIIAWLLAQRALSKDSFLVLVKYVLFCGAVILVMVLPTWMRNLKMYGDILASDYMGMIAVGSSRPAYILLNIYKNLGSLCVLPYTGSLFIHLGHAIAGLLGISLNHEVISFGGIEYIVHYSYNMDLANGAVIIPLLLVIGLYACINRFRNRHYCRVNNNRYRSFVWCLGISAVMTLAITRWQPWGCRLMLHVYLLLLVICGYLLDRMDSEKINIMRGSFCILWELLAVFTVLNTCFAWKYHGAIAMEGVGSSKAEKWRQYFREEPSAEADYEAIISYLLQQGNTEKIGFYTTDTAFEYPLMQVLRENDVELTAVSLSVDPENIGINSDVIPEFILSLSTDINTAEAYWCNGHEYENLQIPNSSNSNYLVYQLKY